jgi:hypothetical protein
VAQVKQVFEIGLPYTRQEVIAAVKRVFPRFPARNLKGSKERLAAALQAMGRLRFEHEINRQRGLAFDAEDIGCTWSRL